MSVTCTSKCALRLNHGSLLYSTFGFLLTQRQAAASLGVQSVLASAGSALNVVQQAQKQKHSCDLQFDVQCKSQMQAELGSSRDDSDS